MKDYYFILGVASDAGNDEIKEAFRKLCLKYHPDRTVSTPHNHERYMDICEAYRTLSNKSKRRAFDKIRQKKIKDSEPISTGILPEIITNYKGHYPWFAAFAILIVAGISVFFIYNTDANPYTNNSEEIRINPSGAPVQRTPAIVNVTDTTAATQLLSTDSSVANTEPAIDSVANKTQQVITSILSQHTASPNSTKYPTRERNYRYSFGDEKLYVTYEKPQTEGRPIRKKVAIPIDGIQSVYCYAGQLWITGRSIKVYDLKSGKRENTDFFSVHFDKAAPNVEQELTNAFAQLKRM